MIVEVFNKKEKSIGFFVEPEFPTIKDMMSTLKKFSSEHEVSYYVVGVGWKFFPAHSLKSVYALLLKYQNEDSNEKIGNC